MARGGLTIKDWCRWSGGGSRTDRGNMTGDTMTPDWMTLCPELMKGAIMAG